MLASENYPPRYFTVLVNDRPFRVGKVSGEFLIFEKPVLRGNRLPVECAIEAESQITALVEAEV